MDLKKNIFILIMCLMFVLLFCAYSVVNYQNIDNIQTIGQNTNETDMTGCCSIVLQLEGNDTILSYRRDADYSADINIEQINWHGKQAIKQYKTAGGNFCHVIITSDGWVIGIGGIDDGVDNEKCENITAGMINDNNTISESALNQIYEIKKPYKKGHVVIKAPNGNYGFATIDKVKTGKLQPGQYISIPNKYQYSRAGNISTNSDDLIKEMVILEQTDGYGLHRRGIVTYDININENNNTTDIYVSNDDGSYFGGDNSSLIDNIHFKNTTINGEDIPIAPNYKKIGSVTFENNIFQIGKLIYWIIIIAFVFFVTILYFIVKRFVLFIKHKIRSEK